MARPAAPLDQAMAIEHGMDGAPGGNPYVAGQPTHQKLPDLARTPMRLLALEADDQAFDRRRQLVGVAHGTPRAAGKGLEPELLVAIEDFVAGLARNAELPAHVRHRLPVQQATNKAQAFLHHRTRFPRHPHLPPKGEKCYPCVRYEVSPMSQAAHMKSLNLRRNPQAVLTPVAGK
jgi:hypothetical protein